MATDRPFVNSCVAGLTAESVSGTSGALKSRIGGLAYVLTTLRTVTDFEPLQLTIDNEMSDGDTPTWSGEALCVVVGNGRQFAADGTTQANMEDGLFEVAIVTDVPAIDLMSDAVLEPVRPGLATHRPVPKPHRWISGATRRTPSDSAWTGRPSSNATSCSLFDRTGCGSSSGRDTTLSDGHVRRRSRERPGDGKSPAEKTMFTVDLHAHTRFFHGFQAEPTPYDPIGARLLALWGRRAGLDGIALTNHDYYRPFDSATGGPQFIPGIEVTTTAGHLLVVGPDPPRRTIPGERTPEEVVSQAHRNGCAAIIAHPYRRSRVRESDAEFDAVEINGKHPDNAERVRALAESLEIPVVGGSDAHYPFEVGRTVTRIEAPELTPEAVVTAIRGAVAVDVRDSRVDELMRTGYEYHRYICDIPMSQPKRQDIGPIRPAPHSYTSPFRSLKPIHVPRVSP